MCLPRASQEGPGGALVRPCWRWHSQREGAQHLHLQRPDRTASTRQAAQDGAGPMASAVAGGWECHSRQLAPTVLTHTEQTLCITLATTKTIVCIPKNLIYFLRRFHFENERVNVRSVAPASFTPKEHRTYSFEHRSQLTI